MYVGSIPAVTSNPTALETATCVGVATAQVVVSPSIGLPVGLLLDSRCQVQLLRPGSSSRQRRTSRMLAMAAVEVAVSRSTMLTTASMSTADGRKVPGSRQRLRPGAVINRAVFPRWPDHTQARCGPQPVTPRCGTARLRGDKKRRHSDQAAAVLDHHPGSNGRSRAAGLSGYTGPTLQEKA